MLSLQQVRVEIAKAVKNEKCDGKGVDCLFTDSGAFQHEDMQWDYKEKCGTEDISKSSLDYQPKVCQIVKDIVAMYNSFGGYILFGIRDLDKAILGYDHSIPVDDIANRIHSDVDFGSSKGSIGFTVFQVVVKKSNVTIIFVPKRNEDIPVSFRKNAKSSELVKPAYKKDEIYHRNGDKSEPANGAALATLISNTQSPYLERVRDYSTLVDHNLPQREDAFVDFIGRADYLSQLWRWLIDPFNTAHLVTGVGGVGKTTLVRQFVEEVLFHSPLGLQKIIWLSAKRRHFQALSDRAVITPDDDLNLFSDDKDLYKKILLQLGYLEGEISKDWSLNDFIRELPLALKLTPSLLVVDDLDTLDSEKQISIFQLLNNVFSRASVLAPVSSRCLMTARLRIGASAAQCTVVTGFDKDEFYKYVRSRPAPFDVLSSLKKDSKLFENFFKASAGSPLFAQSIIRLVARGSKLDVAVDSWKNKKGEDVRYFAFKREIENLSNSQARALFAAATINPFSFIELKSALEVTEESLSDDLLS